MTPERPWVIPVHDDAAPPIVSVLIPSHRPAMLLEALASLRAQTVPRETFQILINDAPEWYGDKINDLARIARGKYLCILPDDDQLAPTFLEKCAAAALGNFDIIYTDIQFFGDRDDGIDLPSFGLNTFRHAACPWMTAFVKKSLWDEVGGHTPGLILQDTDFWIRCALAGADAAHIRERLFLARQHPGNGAKLINKSAAALQLQARYPEIFPSQFLHPIDPDAPTDGRGIVPAVFLPRERTGTARR